MKEVVQHGCSAFLWPLRLTALSHLFVSFLFKGLFFHFFLYFLSFFLRYIFFVLLSLFLSLLNSCFLSNFEILSESLLPYWVCRDKLPSGTWKSCRLGMDMSKYKNSLFCLLIFNQRQSTFSWFTVNIYNKIISSSSQRHKSSLWLVLDMTRKWCSDDSLRLRITS